MADELSAEDTRWLVQLATGGAQMITTDVVERLRARGFVEQKLGGPGVSKAGQEWLVKNGHLGRRPSS